jgi:hypothetical protein
LHNAVHHGDTKVIQILLSAGADRDVRSKVLGTPKEYAISLSFTDAVAVLGGQDASNDAGAADCAAENTPHHGPDQPYRRFQGLRRGPAARDRIIADKNRAALKARDYENMVARVSRDREHVQP